MVKDFNANKFRYMLLTSISLLSIISRGRAFCFGNRAFVHRIQDQITISSSSSAASSLSAQFLSVIGLTSSFGLFGSRGFTNTRSTHTTRIMSKREAPSADRNKEPIWNVLESSLLKKYLSIDDVVNPSSNRRINILEIAGGPGVHTQYLSLNFAKRGIPFTWYPTDAAIDSLPSQKAYIEEYAETLASHVSEPMQLTLTSDGIKENSVNEQIADSSIDLIININMIHISPWSATIGLMKAASSKLKQGGILYLYGPYKVGGTCVESNENFDRVLKSKDPGYGVRNLEDVIDVAQKEGLTWKESIEMPANNLSVLFQKD